ncbi:MAG: hypothetical protein AAF514_18305, partial [Verrucomicrobiota bacterium]
NESNDSNPRELDYPESWTAWLASNRSASSASPSDNPDGDAYDNLMEYALGESPGTGAYRDPQTHGLRLYNEGEAIRAAFHRPSDLLDLRYFLEGSSDATTWSPIGAEPVVDRREDGFERVTFNDLESFQPLSSDGGFVRLRVELGGSRVSSHTPVAAWYRRELKEGYQTVGISTVKPDILSGILASNELRSITVRSGGFLPSLFESDKHYYMEVASGPHTGHRMDLEGASDDSISLDPASPNNTMAALPEEGLVGERFVIREHQTIGGVFNIGQLTTHRDPLSSDQVLVYQGDEKGYDVYSPIEAPGYYQWSKVGDSNLERRGDTVIAPGQGLFFKRAGEAPVSLLVTGNVRENAFIQRLKAGNNLVAEPFPLPASPDSRNLSTNNGFLKSTDPASADQIQIWQDDGSGYQGYFLLGGEGEEGYWTPVDSISLEDADETKLFQPDRAVFLKLQETAHPFYRVEKP